MNINTKLNFSSLKNQTACPHKDLCNISDYKQILTNVELSYDLNNMLLILKQELETHRQQADGKIFFYIDINGIVHITDMYDTVRIDTNVSRDIKVRLLAYLRTYAHNDKSDQEVELLLYNMEIDDLLNELKVLDPASATATEVSDSDSATATEVSYPDSATRILDTVTSQSSNCWSSFLAGLKSLLSIIFCCWLCGRHDSSSKSAS